MPALTQYLPLLRYLGPRWLGFRVAHFLRLRSGALRRATPAVPWAKIPAPALRLVPPPARSGYDTMTWGAEAITESTNSCSGQFRLFSRPAVYLGRPPRWWKNPLLPAGGGIDRHWTSSGDIAGGDLKGLWELSRFTWAFHLGRAYVRSSDPKFAAEFWSLFDNWCAANRPNWGPQWMCGQEATFRMMAVVFAAEAIGVTERRHDDLSRFVVATGRRIAANLDYALSQKNNHGVSECVGLITAALALPDHSESGDWLGRGIGNLRAQLEELVYPDGSFAQHSLIYHRVLLHDLVWCMRRLQGAGQPVPDWLRSAGCRALDFLVKITDIRTGRAPLFGSNDGANILPLADGDFLDLRPALQMAAAVFRHELPLPPGPWDEAAWWMADEWGELHRTAWPQPPSCLHAPIGGYMQLCSAHDRLFLRCPTRFRHRPGQADMLHVDVWHRGEAVAMDGGTFAYNSPERFTALASAAQHNVLTVDAVEPLQKFSRFLYLPWTEGTARETTEGIFEASHDGYAKTGIRWKRQVSRQASGGFMIRDHVAGAAGHKLQWHWRLADAPWRMGQDGVSVEASLAKGKYAMRWNRLEGCSCRLLHADESTAYGWWSPHYGAIQPTWSLLIGVEAKDDVELVMEFQPNE